MESVLLLAPQSSLKLEGKEKERYLTRDTLPIQALREGKLPGGQGPAGWSFKE